MEGRSEQVFYEATLNGLPYHAGEPCGVGWKKLIVRAEDAEPFQTNCFVWYGGEAFGKITLVRSRGSIDLDFSPAVDSVRLTGAEEKKTLNNIARESVSLPTGRYAVEAKFARFSVERTVEVTRNQTTRVTIAPGITTFNLTSEPENAEFELKSKGASQVSVSGRTPTAITDLPAGEYELAIARGNYRKQLLVILTAAKATNDLKMEFRYAKLSITSQPVDALVTDGGKVIGRTPASFDMQPGMHRLNIAKEGYFGTNLDVTLLETDSRAVSVTLENVSFVEALERARKHASGGMDYEGTLAAVEAALRIKPDDAGALQLKRSLEFDWHVRNAQQFQRNREFPQARIEVEAALKLRPSDADALALKAEVEKGQQAVDAERAKVKAAAAVERAETRKNRPEKLLEEICNQLPHNALFDSQSMRFTGAVDAVYEAARHGLQRKPEWRILRDDKVDNDTRVIIAQMTGILKKDKVILVASQTTDEEVVVWFKLFALRGFVDTPNAPLQPFSAKNETGSRAEIINQHLTQDRHEFRKRISDEFYSNAKSN